MMNKRRTRAIGRTKYLMFLPLAALLMVVSNIEAVARATQKITTEVAEAVAPGLQQETAGLVTYKGKVVDRNGQPIEGVQIVILTKDKSHKVLDECSQADGSFLFKAAPDARIGFVYMNSSTTEIQTINSESWGPSREKTIVLGGKPTAPSPAPTVSDKEVSETVGQIFEVVEQMPEFPDGGMAGMMKYLSSHIRYPEAAHKAGTQGRVTVQFVVSKDGSIGNVHILRGVSPELDAEAIRVISAMPKWKPGMQKGEPVSVKYTVPVMFRLQGTPEVQTQPYGTIEKISEVYVTGYGNNKSYTPVDIVEIADEMPQFPGGEKGLMEYLAKHIKYPVLAQEGKKQGRVVVEIVIDTEGRVRNSRIVQGVDTYLDAEALRVTNAMPKWKPGMKDGKPVSVKYSFPITFRLQ